MPDYAIDDHTARLLHELAARRGMQPETLLIDLITHAALQPSPQLPLPGTDEEQKAIEMSEGWRRYDIEQAEDQRAAGGSEPGLSNDQEQPHA